MSKKRKHKRIKKLRKIFQQKVASHKEELLEEAKVEENFKGKIFETKEKKKEEDSRETITEENVKAEDFIFKKNESQDNFNSELKIKMVKFKNKTLKNIKKIKNKNIGKKILEKFSLEGDRAMGKIKSFYHRIVVVLKKWNNIFCTGMTCRTNIKRDIIIITVAILVAAIFLGMGQYTASLKTKIKDRESEISFQKGSEIQFEEENIREIKTIQEQTDLQNWKEYKSDWYGFKIKYPKEWNPPVPSSIKRGSLEDYRVSFFSNNPENKTVIGFDVSIYSVNKVKELSSTSEFPKIKNAQLKAEGKCEALEGHVIETGDYPAEEIYIPAGDDCYDAVLFFSVINGQYLYNISPILKEPISADNDPMVRISDNLPEFFAAVSQFENIDIVRPKPKPVQPKITAPKPAAYKVVNGRMVCEKNNDKPSKSDKGKGKHLDMECCLDPDEYPNPHCYYDPAKYGKYLK